MAVAVTSLVVVRAFSDESGDAEHLPLVRTTFDIDGVVYDAPDIPARVAELEKAAAESVEVVHNMLRRSRPGQDKSAVGVKVILRSPDGTREAVTDTEGRFRFTDVPMGEHELVAVAPNRPGLVPGAQVTAYARSVFDYPSGPYRSDEPIMISPELRLRTDLITITGQVTDTAGSPVGGAKVVAIQDRDNVQDHIDKGYFEANDPRTWWAFTDADGHYVISGIRPSERMFGFVKLEKGWPPDTVDIRVHVDGYLQPKDRMPRVATVAPSHILLGRRFLNNVVNPMCLAAGQTTFVEDPDAKYPAGKGNTITDVNIVVEPLPGR